MRTKMFAICAAAISFAATSAPAQQPPSNTVAKEKQQGLQKVCRWAERTGTKRRERICLTADEWRKVDEHLAKEFD